MRALVWEGPLSSAVREVPAPRPGPGEVLLDVQLAGVCGSDVTAYKGKMGIARPGDVRGHEFGGVVREAGAGVRGIEPGVRAAADPVITCGNCVRCRSGRPTACPRTQIIGVHRPGAFAEQVVVPAEKLRLIPEDLPWETAISAEPLAQAHHNVMLAATGRELGACAVIGCGSIGQWVIHTLRLRGAENIAAADPDRRQRDAAAQAGAGRTVATADDLPAEFDTVFDVVGSPETRQRALRLTANGGCVVSVGLGSDESPLSWFDLIRREITIRGVNCFAPEDYSQALSWLCEGEVPPPQRTLTLDLVEAPGVFDQLAAGHREGKVFFAP